MFSYLGLIQTLVDSSIYSRGIRLYLEGKVSKPLNLDLEYWREYEVFDRITYTVRTPLYHLALKKEIITDPIRVTHSITSYTHCTCEYFSQMGVCKHIVSVFADLENEFTTNVSLKTQNITATDTSKQEIDREISNTILDTIFEVDIAKKTREWEDEFDRFLSQSSEQIPYSLKKMVTVLNNEPSLYTELFISLKKMMINATKEYEKENKLILFALYTLSYTTHIWIDLWLELFEYLAVKNKQKLLLEIWIRGQSMINTKLIQAIQPTLIGLSSEEKKFYITELQTLYTRNKNIFLDFVFVSQAKEWILENYLTLDPLTLLRFVPLIPDNIEEIELSILAQVRQWGDFLTNDDYQQIIDVFRMWSRVIGHSQCFNEAIAYYKTIHKKKKSLLQKLES